LWGLPLVAALAVPWFWLVNVKTGGELFRVFFWYHNVERGFGGGSGKLAAHPWWFYGPRFAGDFLPWTPALVAAVWFFCRRPEARSDPDARFGLVWLAATVVLLSCMRFKRADYLLPAYPGAAWFLGCAAERWFRTRGQRCAGVVRAGIPPFCLATVAGWWFYLDVKVPALERERRYPRFAECIRQRVPQPQLVILFRTKPHALTFHLGQPVDTVLEWENIDIWAGRPGSHYIVMPVGLAGEWPRHVKSGRLVEVLRSSDLGGGSQERPLVLLRTEASPADAAAK
jgi:hypothetical protein